MGDHGEKDQMKKSVDLVSRALINDTEKTMGKTLPCHGNGRIGFVPPTTTTYCDVVLDYTGALYTGDEIRINGRSLRVEGIVEDRSEVGEIVVHCSEEHAPAISSQGTR